MSVPENMPIEPDPGQLSGQWMDGDAEAESPSALSETPPESLGEISEPLPASEPPFETNRNRFEAADLQLVHAMLLHFGDQEPAQRQARIDRVMEAIGRTPAEATVRQTEEARPTAIPRRQARWLIRWVVAVSLLAAAATWFCVSGSNPALAALEQVVQAIDDPIDRTYAISVEPSDQPRPHGPDRKPPQRGADGLPPEDSRPGLDGATLYARGAQQFVLYRPAPGGKVVINGSNGRENWLIRPEKPVLVSSAAGEFRIPMPENLAAIPLVDIRSSLTSLRHGYQLEELPAKTLAGDTSTEWRHLRARKVAPETKGPREISIWFHPETSLIRRIRFDQVNLQGRLQPRHLTISLVSTQPLPADWFEHASHHSPDASLEPADP